MAARRWRLTVWLAGEESHTDSRWYSNDCKLCAAKRAWQLGKAFAEVRHAPELAVRWTVTRYGLHSNNPIVVASSSSVGAELLKRHAHRQPGASNMGSAKRAGRVER